VEPRSTSSISTRLSGGAQLPSSVIVRRRRSPVALPTVSNSSQTPTPATNIDALTISEAGVTAEFEFQLRQCQRHFILVDNFIIDSFRQASNHHQVCCKQITRYLSSRWPTGRSLSLAAVAASAIITQSSLLVTVSLGAPAATPHNLRLFSLQSALYVHRNNSD